VNGTEQKRTEFDMKTIEPIPGDDLYGVLRQAVEQAPSRFTFNEWTFATRAGETLGDARQRFKKEHGFEVLTPEEGAAKAGRDLEKMRTEHAEAIAAAGVATEAQMRDMEPPRLGTAAELAEYVESLVKRPHDYGTCVYAMSLAAGAAFNYAAGKLGVTGFQASVADMQILKHTRGFKWGRILNYENLLYPQYCDAQHFPDAESLIAEHAGELAKRARVLLAENPKAHHEVLAHWRRLAAAG
jgi:hypothetical protein